ncbi:ferritin-like domain-containing protein [Bryobacter aggregatus]|uniref:YciE/YciF ferroxidase family protein n=1 Tax=Bryobacter aggregatus TaxID=360054 RepID=UPI0004E1906D|nr:DUF892 family protein [Bryobacter aggregatus]
MAIETIHDLLITEIRDLYSTEQQLVPLLGRMESAACNNQLRLAFAKHRQDTLEQIERLESILQLMNLRHEGNSSLAMNGLILRMKAAIAESMPESVKDLALVAAAQQIEHVEMSAYSSAHILSYTLGLDEVTNLLQENLEQEEQADMILSEISAAILVAAGKPLEV